ncbi:MAG: hypothetical protein ABI852_13460 [Gemmatimonadaceae bacterium]
MIDDSCALNYDRRCPDWGSCVNLHRNLPERIQMTTVRGWMLTLLALLVVGCGESKSVDPFSPDTGFRREVNPGWPTDSEFIQAGSPGPILSVPAPLSSFTGDRSSFSAGGFVTFGGWITERFDTLQVQLIGSGGIGSPLNSSSMYHHDFSYTRLAGVVDPLGASASTNNVKCGIVGKSRMIGIANLTLFKIGTQSTVLYESSQSTQGNDVTMPACPKAKMKLNAGDGDNYSEVGYRKPSSVTFTNISEVDGSYTCSWAVNGGDYTSTSCSSWDLSALDVGEHHVMLKITD